MESSTRASELRRRRERIYDAIGPEAHAVLQGAGPIGGFEVFRQTNDFFYLGGIDVPQAYLLLNGGARTATLFLPHGDAHAAKSEGAELSADDPDAVTARTGVDFVRPLEELAGALASGIRVAFLPHQTGEGRWECQDTLRHGAKLALADPWDVEPSREMKFVERARAAMPSDVEVRDLSPILNGLRIVKSPAEVAVMRRAGALTGLAVREAMRATRPGIQEYHLGAVAAFVYQVNGVRYEAYRPIIARGENIWFAHYWRNEAELRDGELVLMDVAPDVENYTSDIGRMWPVNGTYSPLQRELYGFIVEYHKALLDVLRPRVTPEQAMEEAAARMAPVVESWAFSKEIYREAARRTLTFKGHCSHPVGMTVHDVGSYFGRPMEPGLVFALDPQMWIPEEQLYIRVEDTVAITETGVEVLTTNVPLELDDTEALIRSSDGGLLVNDLII